MENPCVGVSFYWRCWPRSAALLKRDYNIGVFPIEHLQTTDSGSFLAVITLNVIKKEAPAQVFPYGYYEISQNNIIIEHQQSSLFKKIVEPGA